MSIDHLHLKGFKSFGSSCEFSFSRGFTAIVGPNGSGKSNILDGLRWILGEGSPSALRIVRQSDLLFQGSATVPASKEAEVGIRLSGADGTASLRRQYTAEGGSVLQVDGVRIRMQDLDEVKARFMLEGEDFAFIGQGEVSEAIHQRPMQRRHHLELLFGIDRYRRRREETNIRLESALSEVQRINTLIGELESRREEIAPEVAVAVEAQGILDNLEVLRRDFYFSRRFSLEEKERGLRRQRQLLQAHEDLARQWRNLWGLAVRSGEERLRSQGFDESSFLAREQELASRKDALRRQAFQASTRIKALLEDRADLGAERKRLGEEERVLRAEWDRTRSETSALEARLAECRGALEARLRELEESRAFLERERLRRQTLHDEHAERSLFVARTEARLRALAAAEAEGRNELGRLAGERDRLSAGMGDCTLLRCEEEHRRLVEEHAASYAACQKDAAALQQLRRERMRQEAELDALKSNTESSLYPEPVRLLLSASRLNRMRSRPEVVAEVFSCPSDLAPALEAYLGGRQFWLLVHTFDEAQEGIELLKQRRAGRVTYLPLERCRPRNPDLRFRLPTNGVLGWAIELIETRSPWESALRHLLGDLLVVERYALGSGLVKEGARFPIVTLEGEVFAPSGTVSGGRARQSGGAIAHNRQMAEAAEKIEELKRRMALVEARLKRSEEEERRLAGERDEAAAAVDRAKDDHATLQRALASVTASLDRIEREIAEAAEEMGILNSSLVEAKQRLDLLADEMAELEELPDGEDPSSAVGGLRAELTLAEERLRSSRAISERMEREHGALTVRLSAILEELGAGKKEEQERRAVLADIGREYLSIRRDEAELKLKLEEERGKVRRGHLRLERLRQREQKATATFSALGGEIAAVSERLTAAESERTQLIELWDDKYPYDAAEAREVEGGRDLTGSLRRLERELRALGNYNLGALSEDVSLTERVDFLTEQLEDVRNGVNELKTLIEETDAQVEASFSRAMADIDSRFNALFQRLFAGGEARLTLQEEGTLWDRGVEIYARPPGKKLQNISQLSGGEQSLTAIAHLFAALEVAKIPLAVLDEVDAALDEYNLIRFADLAKEYSRSLQLIVMTHRRTTMERADLIYGVTMVEPGLSRIVGIDVENYR
ncbi:chromosome segregation protein SMC [Fretibacterium sp. OH1220_COT-178]|uniref:chromosome segregation protein SMC n=1 Tax=Fretibacterium sp. OH1220_COT-178 TaxID=2491047 RepID=UPI000F5ED126|nr:chromosome segregation protein SMC [Fretibacterium sp. OH1220_COT-178]RRD65898.1 chromosome segregation protein SMC [Fretibacterium sp. OH1220_COT-178]